MCFVCGWKTCGNLQSKQILMLQPFLGASNPVNISLNESFFVESSFKPTLRL